MKKHGLAGFTLLEMMIVVVVIAILTAVAYPSYQDHVRKAKRSEGKTALLKAAQVLERMYSDRATYGNTPAPPAAPTSIDLAPLFGLAAGATVYSGENPADNRRSAYTIAAAAGACGDLAACYTLTATPVAPDPTPQPDKEPLRLGFVDPVCANFTLTSAGTRSWSNSGDATTAAKCRW